MMRKLLVFLLISSVLFIAGCSGTSETPATSTADTTTAVPNPQPDPPPKRYTTKSGAYYEFDYQDLTHTYRFFDKNQNLMMEETFPKEPRIVDLYDRFFRLTCQAGTGISTQWGYFYDYQNNVRSETLYWIYAQTETLVATGQLHGVVIQSIFDDSYYKEISEFSYPLSQIVEPITSVVFSEDGRYVTITYHTGDDYQIVSEDFPL